MDLKTYQGNSMAEALEKVKKDLGREAVILHTRTVRRGGWLGIGARTVVEITASRNVNVLHPAERRTMLAREPEPEPEPPPGLEASRATYSAPSRATRLASPRGTRLAPSRAAGSGPEAPMGKQARTTGGSQLSAGAIPSGLARPTSEVSALAGPDPRIAAALQSELSQLSSFRGEMEQLRAMVRELLNRPTTPAYGPNPDVPEELRDYYTQLLQSEVADEIARDVIARAQTRLAECKARLAERAEQKGGAGPKNGQEGRPMEAVLKDLVPIVLLESIEKLLPPTEPIQLSPGGPKLVALVGPTGVGKTTTIAKLAAHFKLRERKRVGLITIDTYRIAAVDQLRAYAEILSIPLQVVLTPAEMSAAVELMRDHDVVLIDTSGRSQNDTDKLADLKTFLDAAREAAGPTAGMETHLVLSCTSHPGQLMQVAEKFGVLGIDRAVFTKLDEAVGLGVILNVSHRLNLRLSYLTTGQDVPEDMEIGHRRRVAELILKRAEIKLDSAPVEHVA
ncbi:MAG TPA: flagellar biosynthesis protein FlhF [Phycisphaerae bacterium]|nr:flagellar biosynthesis protein FlhF [Phycisphaerae bacterium]